MNSNLCRSLLQTTRDPKNRKISVVESTKPRHYLWRGFQKPPALRGLICALIVFFPFSTFAASAKLLVKNARIFSMAPQQRAPFTGYFVVAEDGTLTTVSAGDPPSGITAEQVFDAHGEWIIPGLISAHSLSLIHI